MTQTQQKRDLILALRHIKAQAIAGQREIEQDEDAGPFDFIERLREIEGMAVTAIERATR